MTHSMLHDPQLNAIVFEGRHQSYGAFELRLHYEDRMVKSLLLGILLFVSVFLIPFIYSKLKREDVFRIPPSAKEITLQDFKTVVRPKLAEVIHQPAAKPLKPQVKFVPPVVVKDHDPVQEVLPPTVDSLAGKAIGSSNIASPDTTISIEIPERTGQGDPAGQIYEPAVMQSFAVQEQPEFPNGMSALYAFLSREIRYTPAARDNGISGTVYVEFVVSQSGRIEAARILRGIGGGLDQEALRVINRMPAWKPGKHNGRTVPVIMRLPIKFELIR